MNLVEGKCPNCGANIKVDPSKDAAICEYCGSAYVVEKAIVNIDADKVYINTDNVKIEHNEYHARSAFAELIHGFNKLIEEEKDNSPEAKARMKHKQKESEKVLLQIIILLICVLVSLVLWDKYVTPIF